MFLYRALFRTKFGGVHSRRIPAAVSYRLFLRTGDLKTFDDVLKYEGQAIEAWRNIVAAAGDVYAPNLMMGVREAEFQGIVHHLTGHWKDELVCLEAGFEKLQQQRDDLPDSNGLSATVRYQVASVPIDQQLFQINHQPITSAAVGQAITVQAEVSAPAGVKWVRLRYRSVNQHFDYQTLPMVAKKGSDVYQAIVPPEHIDPKWNFMYFIEVMDEAGNGRIYPNLEKETPYFFVRLER